MFGIFTEDARQVVLHAQAEARRRGDGMVTGAYLWLALLAHPDGVALLARLGVAADRLSEEIGRTLPPPGDRRAESYRFTHEAKQAMLEWTDEERRALGSKTIRPQHLVLGLMRDDKGIAVDYLARAGVTLDDLRRALATMGEEGV